MIHVYMQRQTERYKIDRERQNKYSGIQSKRERERYRPRQTDTQTPFSQACKKHALTCKVL